MILGSTRLNAALVEAAEGEVVDVTKPPERLRTLGAHYPYEQEPRTLPPNRCTAVGGR